MKGIQTLSDGMGHASFEDWLLPQLGEPVTLHRVLWLIPLSLLFVVRASADTAEVYVNGSYAFANNGYGIGPYGGTLNGQSAQFFCVDFNHDIVGQTGWTATVTTLPTTTGLALPETLMESSTLYLDEAWMIAQMMAVANNNSLTLTGQRLLEAEYQWAIWSLSVGGNASLPHDPYGTNGTLIANARAAVNGGWSATGWEILTPVSGTGYPNQPGYYGQEFMVAPVPEPSTLLLILTGLCAVIIVSLKK